MRYYGCKTKLLDRIENVASSLQLEKGATFFDIFSGTSAVGQHFKKLGYRVYSNDFLEFAYGIAHCYIQTTEKPKFTKLKRHLKINDIVLYLNELPGEVGFMKGNIYQL